MASCKKMADKSDLRGPVSSKLLRRGTSLDEKEQRDASLDKDRNDIEEGMEIDLEALCLKETGDIKQQENSVNFVTRLFYDVLLELLNETSDVLLMLTLRKLWTRTRNIFALGLFYASLFFLVVEVLVRVATGAVFDVNIPWVTVTSGSGGWTVPKRRVFKKDAPALAIACSILVVLFEPNMGSVLIERLVSFSH